MSSPEAFPRTKARLIKPMSLNCTDCSNEEQRGRGMALMPHSKTKAGSELETWLPHSHSFTHLSKIH